MYELVLQNKSGSKLFFNQLGGQFTITEIEGLSPADATINTNESALMDGATYNSSKVNMRTINMAFAIEHDAEQGRLKVYHVLQSSKYIMITYKSERLNVFVEGYVKSIDVSHFSMKQVVTVSITCPFPYFKAAQEMVNDLSSVINLFHFPFSSTAEPQIVFGYIDPTTSEVVMNNGSIECGLTFELYAKASVTNPKIYNHMTGDYIGINYEMEAGDVITITTGKGNKTVTLLREGVRSNIFNSLMEGITWLQLEVGGSAFVYEIDQGLISNLLVTIKHRDLFEGV